MPRAFLGLMVVSNVVSKYTCQATRFSAILSSMTAGTLPHGSVHVVTTRRQGTHREYVAHLLMHSYREGGKVKKETVANLSHLPDDCIELIRGYLRSEEHTSELQS